jgi:hypothetical protein
MVPILAGHHQWPEMDTIKIKINKVARKCAIHVAAHEEHKQGAQISFHSLEILRNNNLAK